MEEPVLKTLAPLPVNVHLVTAGSSVKPLVVHWIPVTKEVHRPAGRVLASEWSVNSIMMVVYEQRILVVLWTENFDFSQTSYKINYGPVRSK